MLDIAAIVALIRTPLPLCTSRTPFLHSSLYGSRRQGLEAAEDEPINLDYERLEHFGDAILGFNASKLIHTRYPRLTPGAATTLKSRLVCNETLAVLSSHYGLHERLEGAMAQLNGLRQNEGVRADIFEAYIGALYDEHGAEVAEDFLSAILSPLAEGVYSDLNLSMNPAAIEMLSPSSPTMSLTRLPAIPPNPQSPGYNYVGKLLEWQVQAPNRRRVTFGAAQSSGPPNTATHGLRLDVADDSGLVQSFTGQARRVKDAKTQ
ncbi:hypothetical protein P7C70_g1971, partial [Phenoliferia sp. Uapishka_3]